MVGSRKGLNSVAGIVVLVLAVAFGIARRSVLSIPRTTQLTKRLYSTKVAYKGFVFEIEQRANMSDKHPTSVIVSYIPPGSKGAYKNKPGSPPLHIHHKDDELFEVVEGEMGYVFGGKEGILKQGESANLPAGISHTFWNAHPEKRLVQRWRTINRSGEHSLNERFFEQWASNAYDHDGVDNANPIQLILLMKAADIELDLPWPAQMLVRYVLCPFGKLLGYQEMYQEYIYI